MLSIESMFPVRKVYGSSPKLLCYRAIVFLIYELSEGLSL